MTLKRLIVVSDTHGSFSPFYQIITDHLQDCDLFVHLGDGRREVEDVLALHPELPLVALRGNRPVGGRRAPRRMRRRAVWAYPRRGLPHGGGADHSQSRQPVLPARRAAQLWHCGHS